MYTEKFLILSCNAQSGSAWPIVVPAKGFHVQMVLQVI